jgi:hypothetical protein
MQQRFLRLSFDKLSSRSKIQISTTAGDTSWPCTALQFLGLQIFLLLRNF